MKLPNINQRPDKPTSAQSQRSQNLPPKSTSQNLTSNLEKNLFSKLQQYDDLHNIKTVKPLSATQQAVQNQQENNAMQEFLSYPQQDSTKVNDKKKSVMEENEALINSFKHSENKVPQQAKIRFAEEVEFSTNTNETMQSTPKTIEKLRPILLNKQKSQNIEDKQFFITDQQNENQKESEDSDGQQQNEVEAISKRNKDRLKMRKMLNHVEDKDLGQLSNLIFQTNSDMSEFYGSISTFKTTINQMTASVKSLGIGVRPELLEQLDKQYQELLDMQQEDEALDEYDLEEMKQKKQPQLKSKKVETRANSLLVQKPVNKKKSKNNDSFDRN